MDYRDYVLQLAEEGNAMHLLLCCVKYMSQDDLKDMLHYNEIDVPSENEDESYAWDDDQALEEYSLECAYGPEE